MSTQRLRDYKFNTSSRRLISHMNEIIKELEMTLTARQLYYQFIGRDLFPAVDEGKEKGWVDDEYNKKKGLPPGTKNTLKNYKRFAALLTDARYAGLVSWDAIEDRVRRPTIWQDYDNLREAVDRLIRTYRLPRWRGQKYYVELWVEKEALAGQMEPIANEFHVTLMANKGYSSASAMYDSAQRIMQESNQIESEYWDENKDDGREREPVILYVGDHDPSGEDMVRDLEKRLVEFGVQNLTFTKLALTMEQVQRYKLPPNPAKSTDARFETYVAEHGDKSWEVEALPPKVLAKIVRDALEATVDRKLMNAAIAEEKKHKSVLTRACEEVE
jgi:hypothetical protein